MNLRSKQHQAIHDQLVGKTGVKVLVVEGEDDKGFFELLLEKRARLNWASTWTIGHAEGKDKVLSILKLEPTWVGVVDRDEWGDQKIQSQLQDTPNLFVLPRYCMENYFVNPDEIWASLPAEKQNRITGGKAGLQTEIQSTLDEWIRHGALWAAVNPLWNELKNLGFSKDLLDLHIAQDERAIRETLNRWHTHLEPDRIFRQFEANLAAAGQASTEEKFSLKIHGKLFFTQHVSKILDRHLGQQRAAAWLEALRRECPLPADLDPLWTKMGI